MPIKFMDMNDFEFENEFSPLEYLIHMGANGNHVLFDNNRIREAFGKTDSDLADLDSDTVSQVREAVSNIFNIPDFEGKKEFLESLPSEIQDVIIYLYFQMVEKTMIVDNSTRH